MSRRYIECDPSNTRRVAYRELEASGEAMRALWKTIEYLNDRGVDIGPEGREMLRRREELKRQIPK